MTDPNESHDNDEDILDKYDLERAPWDTLFSSSGTVAPTGRVIGKRDKLSQNESAKKFSKEAQNIVEGEDEESDDNYSSD